jgi:hypothetical protein
MDLNLYASHHTNIPSPSAVLSPSSIDEDQEDGFSLDHEKEDNTYEGLVFNVDALTKEDIEEEEDEKGLGEEILLAPGTNLEEHILKQTMLQRKWNEGAATRGGEGVNSITTSTVTPANNNQSWYQQLNTAPSVHRPAIGSERGGFYASAPTTNPAPSPASASFNPHHLNLNFIWDQPPQRVDNKSSASSSSLSHHDHDAVDNGMLISPNKINKDNLNSLFSFSTYQQQQHGGTSSYIPQLHTNWTTTNSSSFLCSNRDTLVALRNSHHPHPAVPTNTTNTHHHHPHQLPPSYLGHSTSPWH